MHTVEGLRATLAAGHEAVYLFDTDAAVFLDTLTPAGEGMLIQRRMVQECEELKARRDKRNAEIDALIDQAIDDGNVDFNPPARPQPGLIRITGADLDAMTGTATASAEPVETEPVTDEDAA